MNKNPIQKRCQGLLLGLAAGDRNGGPIRMALRLAESLLARQTLDLENVRERYLAWWREDGADSGPTSGQVLRLIASGTRPDEAVEKVHRDCQGMTAGCNPAHRAGPMAMAAFLPDDQLPRLVGQEAALTHLHPLAGDVSAAAVVLCRALIHGIPWEEALAIAEADRNPNTKLALREGREKPGGRGGYAPEVLQSSVSFVNQSGDFTGALLDSLRYAGPANYCPVLVGAIAGARWGVDAIDLELLEHTCVLEILPRVETNAAALGSGWSGPSSQPPAVFPT